MQVGQQKYGMQTMNQALAQLIQRRTITMEVGLNASSEPDELRTILATASAAAAARKTQ